MTGASLLIASTEVPSDTSQLGAGYWFFTATFFLFSILSLWKVFEKAEQPGWAAIIPFYNTIILFKIIRKSGWWVLALLIPVVNICIFAWLSYKLAIAYGKGFGYALLLFCLPIVGYTVLGFGGAEYQLKRAS